MLPRDFSCWAEPMLIVSADTAEDDGLLLASEVAELELDADLVVLSACNTAAPGGGSSAAESLSGLARAFFYAGARSLLVTHWPIPDQPTQRLMSELFGAIAAEDLATADALRRAQTSLIDDQKLSHPLNWAAFSVVGDGGQRLQAQPSATAPGRTS
jgi:CHAT domain-containing protein